MHILTLLNSPFISLVSTPFNSCWLTSPEFRFMFHLSNFSQPGWSDTSANFLFQPRWPAFPFGRSVWLAQVAFSLFQGNFTFGDTIRLRFSKSVSATQSPLQLSLVLPLNSTGLSPIGPTCTSSNAQSTSTHANYHRIASHYNRTHRFDAPVPVHKAFQHMQIKYHSTASAKKSKSHLEPSVTLRAQFETDSTVKWRRL